MKIYGNEKTALSLTPKALWVYSTTDPLCIIEQPDGTYSIRGAEERDDMTAQDVNNWLEELADDCLAAAAAKSIADLLCASLSSTALSLADRARASLSSTNLSLADRARAKPGSKMAARR